MRRGPTCHDDRLRMMRNHAGHEVDIGIAVRLIYAHGALLRRRLVDRLLVGLAYWSAGRRRVAAACRIHGQKGEAQYNAPIHVSG